MTSADPAAIQSIREYLDTVEGDPAPSPGSLARAIDTMIMAVHSAPGGEPADGDRAPPERDYKQSYARLAGRFKELGYYAVANPLEVEPPAAMVGDAIDDLADINGDLREVLWRYDALGAEDALWHLHFLFNIHWGRHARELNLYLHALLSNGE